jgi:hypothetical protein
MSVAFTEQAVVARSKTATRRKGWLMLKPGDRLTLCRKVMGRKKGEPLVRLAEVEVVSVQCEPLLALTMDLTYGQNEVCLEGFPDLSPDEFVDRYFVQAQGIDPTTEVRRIEWRYLDGEADQ